MIQGVTYNAGTPNARVAGGDTVDFQDIAQKKANIEQTKAQTEKLKQPEEDKEAAKKKAKIFGDISALDAVGAILPDRDIAVNWINDVWDIALDPNKDLSDPNTEREIYMQAEKVKYMVDKSKEIGEKASALRVKSGEGDMIGANEAVLDIYTGDLPYEEVDANGNVVEKIISAKDVKTIEDYQKYLSAQTKRLSDPVKQFDTYNYIENKADFIKNAWTTEVPSGTGQTIKTIKTEDDKIKFGLQSLWNDKDDLRRMEEYSFRQAKKNNPGYTFQSGKKVSEIKNANEYFVENYLPQLRQKDVTIEGSEKTENVRKNLGGGKGQLGKVMFTRFIDEKGNKTYTFEGITEAENPKREFITTTGEKVAGRPYQWVKEVNKTPILTIRKDTGNGEWEEYSVTYDKATSAGLQYANPFEMDAVLGDGEKGTSAKSTTNTQNAEIKTITTQAEYDALPKGAKYKDSKGTIATKK